LTAGGGFAGVIFPHGWPVKEGILCFFGICEKKVKKNYFFYKVLDTF